MTKHRRGTTMSPGLQKVVERAKRDPTARFHSLAHLLDEEALKRAAGVDNIDKETYGQRLDENVRDLHERLQSRRYRHQPIRRVHIPKEKGKTRPIGLSTIEDKIVQGAVREVLQAIYEQDFVSGSYGFRPGRSAHDALRALDRMAFREGVEWILEADIQEFFDRIDRAKLRELLQVRVADGSLMRLVGKCLQVGVLDGEEFAKPDEGTVQGSVISPLLGNVYLHYALDNWFETEVLPNLSKHARLIRYADDFVMGFQSKEDAERTLALLHERMAEFGLSLHPDKTRLVHFRRPRRRDERANTGTFEFLGFVLFWQKSRTGGWRLAMKTRKARIRRASKSINEWCRRHRHLSQAVQHAKLSRKLRGHYQYFGVNGNMRALQQVFNRARRAWHKWLTRRSQRSRLTWERYAHYLEAFPLPAPRIRVQIWGRAP